MATVHHDVLGQGGFLQRLLAQRNVHTVIVGSAGSTTQYDVSVTVAPGLEDGDLALTVDTQEAMGIADGLHGVDRDVEATVGAVFEAHSRRKPTGHFPVGL